MKVDGFGNVRPIKEVPVKGAKSTGIQYSAKYAEFEACIASGLDISKWRRGGYSSTLMNEIVGWWDLHNLVELHSQVAARPKK